MIIKYEFVTSKGKLIKGESTEFDRNYADEDYALIFIQDEDSKEDGYFELNIYKDADNHAKNDGYVCEYASSDATEPDNMIEDVMIEVIDCYAVTYVGLSDDDYVANGYSEVFICETLEKAKAKLATLREDELADLADQGREYEILEDEDDEFRVSWCCHGEQVRIEVKPVRFSK